MILGIDPGLSGALAVYDPETNEIKACCPVPLLTIERGGKTKNTIDIRSLLTTGKHYREFYPDLKATIELVGSNIVHGRKQSGSSMFSFGKTDGILETMLVALDIPYMRVPPATWKKALNCSADKDTSLLRAGQLIPNSAHLWTPSRGWLNKEKCKAIAEASLIAYWGAKNFC